ncbi:MAG: hypothetical protein ACE5HI_17185 [bacterium]
MDTIINRNTMPQEMTLGCALAYIAEEIKTNKILEWPELSESANNYLQDLREYRQKIISLNCAESIFAALPEPCCQTEKPHLAENAELFIVHFLMYPEDDHKSKHCKRLANHLNDCFRCFEEFCQVLRDYYYKNQELSE